MELILIKSYKHLSVYEKEWSVILEEKQNTNPFIEYEFVYNWWRFFGEGKEIEIYAVKDNNRMIAFFPFQSNKIWFGYVVHFLALGDANYMDVVARSADMNRAIMFAFDELIKRKKHVVFYLHGLLESEKTPFQLSSYLKARSMKEKYYRIVTPYIDLRDLSYDDYMQSRQKLHGLDRREKRLRLLGEACLQISPSTEMDKIYEVHQKRWEKKNDTSGFSSEQKKAFFQYLADQNSGQLSVRLTTLTLENEIIAFTYGFSCRGRYLGYVLGHDSDFDVYGPGRILVKEKIKKNIEDGFHKLDMSIGYEPYKFEWNTDNDFTRKTIFSTNTWKAKAYRNYLWVKEMCISKLRKYYFIVIFRRNSIGKLKYYLRNREKLPLRKVFWNKAFLPFLYERKQYMIAKLIPNGVNKNSNYQKVTPEMALSIKKNRKEILQKIYNGYKGYYARDTDKAFWVNENVIRLDDIDFVMNLKKKSVYIKDWENEDLDEIISYVQQNYHPKHIFVHVNKRNKKAVQFLERYGFEMIEKLSYSQKFGNKKIKNEVLI